MEEQPKIAKIMELAAATGQGYGTVFKALEDAINIPNMEQKQIIFEIKPYHCEYLYLRGDTVPRTSKHSKARQQRFKAKKRKK